MDALRFERVSKRYRASGPLALDDVSFAIDEGSRTCLLGPNGAGKSTSIRLLEGALQPTRGQVTLLQAAVDSDAYLRARQRTGVVPQGPGMYSDLSVAEYLELAHDLYGRGDVAAVVELLALAEHLHKPLAQLSGGYQRRVVIATALLPRPDLLLLDEPTVGLDPIATHDVHAFLRDAMRQPGRTTLLCTHNLAEAEALCDNVIILRDGRVLVHAPLAELRQRTRPQLRLEARQGRAPLIAALRRRELDPRPEADGDGVLITIDNPTHAAPDLLRGLLADGLDIFACQPVQVTLETLFLELVRGA
jgi:ABC-2 type transport system ATP-binding protein